MSVSWQRRISPQNLLRCSARAAARTALTVSAQADVMLETSMQKPIHEAIVKRLEDKSIEVQTVAVKWCVRRPPARLQTAPPRAAWPQL
jgi:hypothetical protein